MEKEKLVENVITFIPFMFKRLMKSFADVEISRHLLELLHKIEKHKNKPMSYYSELMMIPKPNLTVLADKLIKMGLVERAYDPDDRRVVTLNITPKGDEFLREHKEKVKAQMMKKFDSLSDEDITRMNELLEELRAIFSKLD